MFSAIASQPRPAWVRLAFIVLVACAFAGCKKDQTDQAGAAAGGEGDAPAAQDAEQPAVASEVNAMSADQLRDAAGKALREQRLYAPGGDNAMEYYLALRDKQPNDPAVSSALTDLQPYALIATEQSIGRDDFTEAQRLYALLEKTDPRHPALPRLQKAITDGRTELAARQQREQLQAEEEAKRQAELERQRVADQQEAARKLEADRVAREREQRQQSEQQSAPATTTRQNQPAAGQPPAQPATQAAEPPKPQVANTLRPVSLPNPAYPRQAALRRRSGTVEVEFTVGTDGRVTASRVVRASPPRVFDRAALEAVDKWRFEPLGAPITSRRTINFEPAD